MSWFLLGLGCGVGFYAAGILYVMAAHWRPTPWWGRNTIGPKTWKWNRRLVTKCWPICEWPRWSL